MIAGDGVPTLEDEFWCQLLDWTEMELSDKQLANVLRAIAENAYLKVTVTDWNGEVI